MGWLKIETSIINFYHQNICTVVYPYANKYVCVWNIKYEISPLGFISFNHKIIVWRSASIPWGILSMKWYRYYDCYSQAVFVNMFIHAWIKIHRAYRLRKLPITLTFVKFFYKSHNIQHDILKKCSHFLSIYQHIIITICFKNTRVYELNYKGWIMIS